MSESPEDAVESVAPAPQPVYVAQPVAYPVYVAAPSQPKGMSVASLVLGLVSIFLGFTFVLPVVGLILGIVGARREPAGRGMAVTGIVLSSVILAGWVIFGVIFLIVLTISGGVALTSR